MLRSPRRVGRHVFFTLLFVGGLLLGSGVVFGQNTPPPAPPGYATRRVAEIPSYTNFYHGALLMADLAERPAIDPTGFLSDPFSEDRMEVVLSGLQRPVAGFPTNNPPFTRLYAASVEVIRQDIGVFNIVHSFVSRSIASNLNLYYSSLALADYDRDGDLDLVASGATALAPNFTPVTRLLRHDGNLNFIDSGIALPALHSCSAAWGDYDNDGDPDLLLTGVNASKQAQTSLHRNDGDGIFTPVQTAIAPAAYGEAAWGDYDRDGDLDIVLTGARDDGAFITAIYRNDGGTFVDIAAGLPGLSQSNAAWFDYDSDGDLDLVLAGGFLNPFIMNGRTAIFQNNGNDTFVEIAFDGADLFGGDLQVGDLDHDGDLDFMVSGFSRIGSPFFTEIYRNDGGTFVLHHAISETLGSSFAFGDYDHDNDLDILITGFMPILSPPVASDPPSTMFYINNLPANAPPSVPAGLRTTVDGPTVTFSWNPATDDRTPAPGLTYNLRIGTAPGTDDLYSAFSDPETGERWLSAPGNTGHATTWQLSGLPPGTFYWSVQAIDASYAGSAFAPDLPFTPGDPDDAIPPTTPPNFTATGGIGMVTLTWDPSPEPDVSRYRIFRGTNPEPTTFLVSVLRDTNSYVDTNLVNGTRYFYRITALDETGNESTFSPSRTAIPTNLFTETPTGLPGSNNGALAWGDYDRDGDLDVVLQSNSDLRPYQNNNGGFNPEPRMTLGFNSHVAWGDYDNDGDLDILYNGSTPIGAGAAAVFRNDNATFVLASVGLPPFNNAASAWGDYDNDGDLDILIAGRNATLTPTTHIFRNETGSFVEAEIGLPGLFNGDVSWIDYDGDGDLDILLSGTNGPTVATHLLRNDNGPFTDSGIALQSVTNSDAAWGDYDNDGDPDLLLTGQDAEQNRFSLLYRNDGTAFTVVDAGLRAVESGDVDWGDYDGDGDLDILLTGNNNTLVYRNDAGVFSALDFRPDGIGNSAAAWADVDGDGDLDVTYSGQNGSSFPFQQITKVLLNNLPVINTAPAAPTGLSTQASSQTLTLTWNPATDAETPSRGLTYNLRVGTTTGGINVLAPMADPTTGKRYIPGQGNAGHTTQWTLNNLPPGTYFWSVQTIDPGHQHSAFAPEQSITVTGATTKTDLEEERAPPLRFALSPNYPNPFRDQTEIRYSLPETTPVRLVVYDVLGRAVKVLVNEVQPTGAYSVVWDGRGPSDERLGSGLYVLSLATKTGRLANLITLFR